MTELIYREGLEGIVAGETAISNIDQGLNYRGYSIEELAEYATFEEVAYLLLQGDLPESRQLSNFRRRVADDAAAVDPAIFEILQRVPSTAPMMDVLRTGASLLAHFDPDVQDSSPEANLRKAERLLAQLPVLMAASYRLRQGDEPIEPQSKNSLAANVLWMLRGESPPTKHVRALEVTLILYAEHEYNASSFTARVISSTLSDLHSAVTGAIGALKGPLHGGANERVMEVLLEVGSPKRAEEWVQEALAKKQRIMGFGHRVYKAGDPRASLLKPLCRQLAAETNNEVLEKTAETIETIIKAEKNLPPNLDWPSGRLYYYLGLPIELYTPLFAVSRVAGWSAHVMEQLKNNRLIRPRSRYVGPPTRHWVPLDSRSY